MKLDKRTIWILAGLVGGGVALNWLLNHFDVVGNVLGFVWGLVFPFVLGFILAFLLNLPMRALERWLFRRNPQSRAKRPVCFVLSLVLVIAVIAFVVLLVVPQLWKTLLSLANSMPGYVSELQTTLQPYLDYLPQVEAWLESLNVDWRDLVATLTSFLQNGAGNFLSSAVDIATSFVGGVVSFFVAVIFAVYLLLDKEHLTAQLQGLLKAYLPEKRYEKLVDLGRLTYFNYASFVSSQCIEALVLTVIYFAVLLVGGFEYSLLIAVFIGFTSLIPMIGAWLGGALGVILLLVSMGFWRAFWFVVIMAVVQQLDGNLIYPHIVGQGMGLPAIWILVAVMVGGGFGGIFGMMFFIPLFSVLYTLLHRDARTRLEAKGIPSPVRDLPAKAPRKRRSFFARRPAGGGAEDGANTDDGEQNIGDDKNSK